MDPEEGGGSGCADSNPISVSVIIPALNEEHMIGKCLSQLAQLDDGSPRFEVIVVDNGSRDRTLEVAQQGGVGLDLRILSMKNVTIAALRNLGACEARGEYLAFLDADCLVPQTWLINAMSHFADNEGAVLGAPYSLPADSSWVARTWHSHQQTKLGDVSYVPGGDLLIRRSDHLRLEGFNESLQTNEDYEFCQRAWRCGLAVRAFEGISVCHLGTPQTLWEFYRKQRWHGTHVFKVFVQSLPRLRNLKAVAFAFYVLLCLAGLGASLLLMLTGWGYYRWLLIFAAAFVLLPGALSIRSALARRALSQAAPLTVLFLIFGVARAACLIGGLRVGRTQQTP